VSRANKKKLTIREIELMLSALANKVSSIENSINKIVMPGMTASMNMFEIYVDMKGDLNDLVEKINEYAEKTTRKENELQEAGQEKQAEGSGTSETSGETS
jgi:thiamine phosphate synthase YjbQ (UPF0047 family)